jgi:hypothetical protein
VGGLSPIGALEYSGCVPMAWIHLHSGFASMFGSFLAWALSFTTPGKLHVYQVCSNAIDPKYLNEWMEEFWVRLGWDKDDTSTWKDEYLKMPLHREVETFKFCPDAWKAMCENNHFHLT